MGKFMGKKFKKADLFDIFKVPYVFINNPLKPLFLPTCLGPPINTILVLRSSVTGRFIYRCLILSIVW
jgi:hypothetical protein